MAFYKQDIVDINLNTGSIFRSFLAHSIGFKDDDADRFGIRAFRDGVPVDLSGASCQAIFMNPNGTNIALTSYGTVSGNVAYVTLPPACYDYEGQFCLAIKLVGGGVTGTVRIVDGMVINTGASGTVSPTSAVPTYQEILSTYDAMVAATSAANLAIAETFDATKAYPAGKYVINEGHLYRLTADHAANVTWANTSKVATNFGDDLSSLKSAISNDEESIYSFNSEKTPTATVNDWNIDANTGLAVSDSSYDIVKFAVTAGKVVKVTTNGLFQFQNSFNVPSTAPSNRVGTTYGSGTNILLVPSTATCIIAAVLKSGGTINVYDASDNIAKNTQNISDIRSALIDDGWDMYFAQPGNYPSFTVGASNVITVTIPSSYIRLKKINLDSKYITYGATVSYAGSASYDVPHDKCLVYDHANRTILVSSGDSISLSNEYTILFYNSSGAVHGPWNRYWLLQQIRQAWDSPALTGNPTAPTQAELDNSTKIATTAHASKKLEAVMYDDWDVYFYGKDNYPTFSIASNNAITVTIPNTIRLKRVIIDSANPYIVFGSSITYAGQYEYTVAHDKCLALDYENKTLVVTSGDTAYISSKYKVLFYNSGGSINGSWNRYWLLQKLNIVEQKVEQIDAGIGLVKDVNNARHIPSNAATPLTILHFSDIHADSSALTRILNKASGISGMIDGMICTGDMTLNQAGSISSWWNEDIMTCMGNHDTCTYSSETGYDWTALSLADRISYYISPFESNWGITRQTGKTYYYKDYTTQKVRLIVMDAMIYISGGTDATDQTTWLANLLSDAISSNLHVLIAIHGPHNGSTAKACSFSKYGQGTCGLDPSCNTPQDVIDAVSSAIQSGLHFIGYICGHTHQDNMWDAEGDGKQMMYCITCANVVQEAQWITSDQHRSTAEDAFNLVTIDTANTLVKIVRGGGADIDNKTRTRKGITFNYSTGVIVGEIL